jgi:hypothetical protein
LINSSFPKRLVTRNPSARLFKGPPTQPELMDPPFYLAFHYPRLFQDLYVFGDGGLGRAESSA